jgi:hypothetical protein
MGTGDFNRRYDERTAANYTANAYIPGSESHYGLEEAEAC